MDFQIGQTIFVSEDCPVKEAAGIILQITAIHSNGDAELETLDGGDYYVLPLESLMELPFEEGERVRIRGLNTAQNLVVDGVIPGFCWIENTGRHGEGDFWPWAMIEKVAE